jgi:hypothetical protein
LHDDKVIASMQPRGLPSLLLSIYGWTVTPIGPSDWESPPRNRLSTRWSKFNARVLKKLESKLEPEDRVDVAERQLGRSQRRSGEESRASVAMLQAKARYLQQAGRFDEALIVSNSVYAKRLQFQGPEHRDTLDAELHLAILLAQSKRFEDAERHLVHVVGATADSTDSDRATASVAAQWLRHTRRELRRDEE